MSLLIGRARAGNLTRHDRSGDGTLRRSSLSKGILSSPYPTGGVSGRATSPGSSLGSFYTKEHETPKLQAGRAWCYCSCQSGRNTADVHVRGLVAILTIPPATRTHPAVIVPATQGHDDDR